ncbi:MAG TPA: DUF4194 domain-containing protein [Caulobacteraceae bacterium]|nr:DUF4194 domain-containing protein [Caulobacteraceae bacterium]
MLSEFRQLEERDPALMGRITHLIARLLRDQFIHRQDHGSARLLETLYRPVAVTLLRDYFDVAGYRLVVRENEGWAGILPDLERISAPRMRIDETLVLLVLRRLWEESVHNGDIEEGGSVLLTLNEAYAAYEDVVSRGRRAAMPAVQFRDVVRSVERRAIVHLGAVEDDDMELTIRPIVTLAAGDEFLVHLEQLLQGAEFDEEPSAEVDEAEEDLPVQDVDALA